MNPATHPSAIKAEGKRHELFQFIADCVSSGLQSSGVKPDEAVLLGGSVANQLADTFGGQTIAFPRDMARRWREREEQAYAAFTGNNYAELAQRFQMTERGMRMLLKRAQTRQKAKSGCLTKPFSGALGKALEE